MQRLQKEKMNISNKASSIAYNVFLLILISLGLFSQFGCKPAGYNSPGNTLIVFGNGEIREVTPDQRTVWSYQVQPAFWSRVIRSALRIPNGNTLIPEFYNHRVVEVDKAGRTVWEYGDAAIVGKGPGLLYFPTHAFPCKNGNILIADYYRVLEVNRQKKIVWEDGTDHTPEIAWALPLDNGHVLRDNYDNRPPCPTDYFDEDDSNTVLRGLKLSGPDQIQPNIYWHSRLDVSDDGVDNYNDGGWLELRSDCSTTIHRGKLYDNGGSLRVWRVGRGHFLIAGMDMGDKVTEIDEAGTTVWEYTIPGLQPVFAQRIGDIALNIKK